MPPIRPFTPSSRLPKAPLTKTPIRTPYRRLTATQRQPLITWPEFEAAHRANETIRSQYLAAGRKRSIRLDRAVLDELDRNAAKYLYANNTDARIQFAQVVTDHIGELVKADEDTVFSSITLTPNQFVLAEDAAASFDPKRLQAWARQELRGLDFVGMVEPAFYTNVGDIMAGVRRVVSWHVHVIGWGVAAPRLTEIMSGINDRYDALLPGVNVAEFDLIAKEDVIGKALYALKAPQSEYRVYPKRVTRRLTSKRARSRPQQPAGLSSGSAPFAPPALFGVQRARRQMPRPLLFAGGNRAQVLKAIRERPEAAARLRAFAPCPDGRRAKPIFAVATSGLTLSHDGPSARTWS